MKILGKTKNRSTYFNFRSTYTHIDYLMRDILIL